MMKIRNNWKIQQIAKRVERKKGFIEKYNLTNFEPRFEFTNLPETERLTFEILNETNYLAVYELFANDTNPFVLSSYKKLTEWEEYIDFQLYINRNASKRASCDWLIKRKSSKDIIGVLNIHDLTLETYNDKHKTCFLGYTIGEKYRNKKYATESVTILIQYLFTHLKMEKLLAYTEKENEISIQFLKKMNFTDVTNDFLYANKYNYYKLNKHNGKKEAHSIENTT